MTILVYNSIHKPPALLVRTEKVLSLQRAESSLYHSFRCRRLMNGFFRTPDAHSSSYLYLTSSSENKQHTTFDPERKGEITMSLSTIIFIVLLLGVAVGVKNPWIGGVTALLIAPPIFYFSISSNVLLLVLITLICFLLSVASGFASFILFSGLKGKGHKPGTAYMSGFGVHHPGGIILSNGERKVLKDKNIRREIVISY